MTPENCKKLLEMGILQAYAEGKKIEVLISDWERWEDITGKPGGLQWDSPPENYRIKPEPQFKVGDLVRSPHNIIYKVTRTYPDTCELLLDTNNSRITLHNCDLTKVHKVRTPFTFEQAVKACAEHGYRVRYGTLEGYINQIDHISIDISDRYLYYNKECLETVFTSDNTPFCNISYEPITN